MKIVVPAAENVFGVVHSNESYVLGETREETFRRLATAAFSTDEIKANRLWVGGESSEYEPVYLMQAIHDIGKQPSQEIIDLLAKRLYVPTPHRLGKDEHAWHAYEPSDDQGNTLANLAFHHTPDLESLERLVESQKSRG